MELYLLLLPYLLLRLLLPTSATDSRKCGPHLQHPYFMQLPYSMGASNATDCSTCAGHTRTR